MKDHRMPSGLDQQGRYATRGHPPSPFDELERAPAPAEACTEVGADGPPHPPLRLVGAVIAMVIVAALVAALA
jgi:hypothetical protein